MFLSVGQQQRGGRYWTLFRQVFFPSSEAGMHRSRATSLDEGAFFQGARRIGDSKNGLSTTEPLERSVGSEIRTHECTPCPWPRDDVTPSDDLVADHRSLSREYIKRTSQSYPFIVNISNSRVFHDPAQLGGKRLGFEPVRIPRRARHLTSDCPV